SFTVGHEDGTFAFPASQPGGGGKELRKQLRALKEFIYGFDFVKLKPDTTTLAGEAPAGLSVRGLAEPGRAYAFYLRTKPANKGSDVPKRADEVALRLALPAGSYKAEWIDPISGKMVKDETFAHDGKERPLVAPAFGDDLALRVRRTEGK